ncbi:MAG: pseudouridine synthase, partial [Bacillota bacterium]
MSLLRLDKIIADSGLATRSEARRLIAEGRVWVDGQAVTRPDFKADVETAEITLDGSPLAGGRFRYLMLNKPAGALSATEDRAQKTVLDLLPEEYRRLGLFPVGRLDKDTTGLLLLTNDGDFCHRLTSPVKQVEKRYEVTVDGALDAADVAAFAAGLTL